jgi:hypothetical protein
VGAPGGRRALTLGDLGSQGGEGIAGPDELANDRGGCDELAHLAVLPAAPSGLCASASEAAARAAAPSP